MARRRHPPHQADVTQETELAGEFPPVEPQLPAHVVEHLLSCHGVQDELAAGGQEREAVLHLLLQHGAHDAGEPPVLQVEAGLLVLLSDEVQDRKHRLVRRAAQASLELLKEHGRRLSGPEQEQRVDVGHVESLVEEVDRKQDVDVAST